MPRSRLPNHYGLLGLYRDASFEEIRQAFRYRAKQFHPDLNQSADARDGFLALSEAYYVLRDPERRADFDAARAHEAALARGRSAKAWSAGLAFAGLVGAAGFVLANVETDVPIARRSTNDSTQLASMPALADRTRIAAASALPDDTIRDDWQANAAPTQMPLVTAPDILDDEFAAAKAEPVEPALAHEPAAADPPPVARPAAKPAAAVVPRVHAAVVRGVRHARMAVAAHASSLPRAIKKRHHVARNGVKRHYASR